MRQGEPLIWGRPPLWPGKVSVILRVRPREFLAVELPRARVGVCRKSFDHYHGSCIRPEPITTDEAAEVGLRMPPRPADERHHEDAEPEGNGAVQGELHGGRMAKVEQMKSRRHREAPRIW
jgi:hypothetical protein